MENDIEKLLKIYKSKLNVVNINIDSTPKNPSQREYIASLNLKSAMLETFIEDLETLNLKFK